MSDVWLRLKAGFEEGLCVGTEKFLSVVRELVSGAVDVVLEMKVWLKLVLRGKVDCEFGIVEVL